jgi:HEAT repeat protein
LLLCLVGCATAPPAPQQQQQPTVTPPVISWEDKLTWILRLEDQRILRDPNPPPPLVLVPATNTRPQIVAPPPPSDLIRLLADPEARTRRRSALAVGRVGLAEGVEPLSKLLTEDEVEVRQMAAFALGLIGDPAARPALTAALKDASPIVQGRAAEALGLIGDRGDAMVVSAMVQAQIKAGALMGISPDDLTYPLAPPAEAVRLGLYALVRLGTYDALAAAALDANGQPVSTWWPVAYALQRFGDAKAAPALLKLLETPGRFTAAFAARGLGVTKAPAAVAPLQQIVEQRRADPAIVIQAIRALGTIGDRSAAPVLTRIVADAKADQTLRIEAMTALGAVVRSDSVDLMLDLVSDSSPGIRGAALRALARVDPDTFVATLSGLDPDRDWTVRTAQASALASLPNGQGVARLMSLLADQDLRVIPSVMAALVTAKAPTADRVLIDRLKADDFVVRAAAANGLAEMKLAAACRR